MSELADYQRRVAAALTSGGTAADPVGADVVRWSVHQWAAALLRGVCPLTGTLLVLRGRYADDVAAHVARGRRPSSLHVWGRAFLLALGDDADRTVADVALLELSMSAPAHNRPPLPDPWVWDRDPSQVARCLASGRDPVGVPLAPRPLLVFRDPTGRLVTGAA